MAYMQAQIQCNMYTLMPAYIKVKEGTAEMHVLKLLKNPYDRRQARKVWTYY